jgi:hypothetical protein
MTNSEAVANSNGRPVLFTACLRNQEERVAPEPAELSLKIPKTSFLSPLPSELEPTREEEPEVLHRGPHRSGFQRHRLDSHPQYQRQAGFPLCGNRELRIVNIPPHFNSLWRLGA